MVCRPINRLNLSEADIIHVQWATASTLGPAFLRTLGRETRPVIWTLRDMWCFTGGCHFSGECNRYSLGCGRCPLLGSQNEIITQRDVSFKRQNIPAQHTILAISKSIAKLARSSLVLRDRNIEVIPNAVAIQNFQAIGKYEARKLLGLPEDAFILTSGALNLADPRKGAEILKKIMSKLSANENVIICLFGSGMSKLGFDEASNRINFGSVSDDQKLNLIYAAADLFIMPSLQESFGKVTIEAMASGTAVLAFAGTPAEEMICHGRTGWLVPHNNSQAMIAAIATAMELGREKLSEMGRIASVESISRYTPAIIANNHIELYSKLIKQSAKSGPLVKLA